MKPDSSPARRDLVERAHLKDPRDASHVMHRYAPSQDLTNLLRQFWVPVWSVPPGQEAPQKVLRHVHLPAVLGVDAEGWWSGSGR